jgi:Fis family transcriptional regulator
MSESEVSDTTSNGNNGAPGASAFILSQHVRTALGDYFARLDGQDSANLYALVLREVEHPLIETVLEHCGRNQSKAAEVLGLSRSTLRKKMTQYGIA